MHLFLAYFIIKICINRLKNIRIRMFSERINKIAGLLIGWWIRTTLSIFSATNGFKRNKCEIKMKNCRRLPERFAQTHHGTYKTLPEACCRLLQRYEILGTKTEKNRNKLWKILNHFEKMISQIIWTKNFYHVRIVFPGPKTQKGKR